MWIQLPGFDARHAFSTRRGGISPPPCHTLDLSLIEGAPADPERRARADENARRLASALDLDVGQIATVRQVHGTRIVEVVTDDGDGAEGARGPDPDRVAFSPRAGRSALCPPLAEADGLITRARHVALAIRTADCVPILIAARPSAPSPGIAALHAGWRGTLGQIAARAVHLLGDRFGIAPAQLSAAIGPCIGPCCYAVSPALARDFAARFGESCIARGAEDGQPHLDLRQANRQALLEAGLRPEAIQKSDRCTACARDLFFSHRRDQGRTGRHLSLIALP